MKTLETLAERNVFVLTSPGDFHHFLAAMDAWSVECGIDVEYVALVCHIDGQAISAWRVCDEQNISAFLLRWAQG